MANIKYLVKNLSSNIVLLSYQNSNDNMWNYQVVLRPGQIKNIWCVEGTLSHSGRNSDVSITIDTSTCSSITPTTSPTPIVGDSNPLVLTPVYYPGSIGVVYTLSSKYPSDTDITVSFTNILGTNDNGVITINSSVTLFVGEKSGTTQVVIDGDFTTLNDSSLFSDVIVTTDSPSQYFEIPVSAPPLVFRPVKPIDPTFLTSFLVESCCYSGLTGFMFLPVGGEFTPDWIGTTVVDSTGNCYYVISESPIFVASETMRPRVFTYGDKYYKDCKTCLSKFPCDEVIPTPTPTVTPTQNPCNTPTPTPTVSKACPTSQPIINTVFNTSGDTFMVYFTTQGCCNNLTVSWSSNNITWNNSTAGCGSPRTITIANSSSYPILYFRITQMCSGCNDINSNVLTFNTVTVTPTSTPGVTPTVTPTISLTPSKTPTQTPTKTPTQTPTQTPLRYRAYIVQSCCDPSVTGVILLPTTVIIGLTIVTTGKLCMSIIDKAPKGALPTYTWDSQSIFEGCEECQQNFPCQLTPTPTPTQTVTPTLTLGYTPCIEITSECGTQIAQPGEIINGYVSYTFISGQGYPVLIYWDNGNWIVYNTQTEEKCAYLPSFSQYPVGTLSEWISSTPPTAGCSCLAKDTGFNTVLSYCPTPTPTPTSTPTPTPAFCEGNLVTNGNFDSSLSGWSQSIVSNWEWSDYFGGSAHYIGLDEEGTLYQDILTEGATYNVTFTLYNYAPCTQYGYVTVVAGDTFEGPITDTGVTYQNITIVCGNGTNFGINAMDACGSGTTGTIYIDNVCITEIAGPTPTPTSTNGTTPTPTPTNTVTPTVTPTSTPVGCIDCEVSGYSYIISNSTTTPPTATVCGRIITTSNSTLTVLSDGTPISYASNVTEWNNYCNSNTPCYTYWQFNTAEAYRGCMYNQPAINNLAPAGFRGLTYADISYFISCYGNANVFAANTGHWNLSFWTNRIQAGETGVNFQGYGWGSWNPSSNQIDWVYDGRAEVHGFTNITAPYYTSYVSIISGQIYWGVSVETNYLKIPKYARFIKL